ncbi:7616_t:CDS:2 [Entrophospora sp. SA101]|nr:7616_t:CDS:2 [Entrophospora sp. SA101]
MKEKSNLKTGCLENFVFPQWFYADFSVDFTQKKIPDVGTGEETSTNPIASIFAWTRGLAHRTGLDGNDKLLKLSTDLEQTCIDSVDIHGKMTKDSALSIHGKNLKREHHVNIDEF